MRSSAVAIKTLEAAAKNTRARIISYCEMERHRPFTQNYEFWRSSKEQILELLQRRLKTYASKMSPDCEEDDDKELLRKLGDSGVVLNSIVDLLRLSLSDKYIKELEVIAGVLGYFKIASTRIIDVIPMFIEHEFLIGFSVELRKTLVTNLGLTGDNGVQKCLEYAADDPDIRDARVKLNGELEILDDVTNILSRY